MAACSVIALTCACGPATTGQAVSSVPPRDAASTAAPATGSATAFRSFSSALPLSGNGARLVRRANDLVLQLRLRNDGSEPLALNQLGFDEREQLVTLVDVPRRAGYAPLVASGPDARIGEVTATLAPGAEATYTAVFPAPPQETTSMLVALDGLLPAQVPVTTDASVLTDDPVLQATAGGTASAGAAPADRIGPLICPNGPAPRSTGTPAASTITLPGDVTFAFGQADLTPAAIAALDELTGRIKAGAGTIAVAGHTDSVGSDGDNQALSQRRAAAVAAALGESLGTDWKVSTEGFGETKPVAPNAKPDGSDDPDGRARNRRVELTVTQEAAASTAADAEPRGRADADPVDASLRLSPGTVARSGGLALAEVTVTNAGSAETPFLVINGQNPQQIETGEVGVIDAAGATHEPCAFTPPTYFTELGTLSDRFLAYPSGKVPAGGEVTLWALVDATGLDAAATKVGVAGFADPVTASVSGS